MSSATPPLAVRRSLTPRRITALLLIVVTAAGLAASSATGGPDRVTVPPGARAGQLDLEPCTYTAGKARLRADCGTFVVPENRRDPRSRLIALPVTRIHAERDGARPPLLRLEGGPGKTNMAFPAAAQLAGRRDVVLVGYRGVDGSSRLDCPEVTAALERPRDLLGGAARRETGAGFRRCADRLRGDGVDLAGYTLPERVEDLEAARKALGYGRVDLVSESMGTRIAMIYAERHPRSIHRSVMVGVNPPGRFLWDGAASDGQIRRYAGLCARDEACRERTGDLAATLRRGARDVPDRWGLLPVRAGNVRIGSFFGLMEATPAASPLNAPMTFDAFLSAADGDASGLWLQSLMATLVFPEAQVWGDVAAIARADARAARRAFAAGGGRDSILANAGSRFLFGGGDLIAAWPANPDDDAYSRLRPSDTETLLVSGEMDGATPPGNAGELLPLLRNGRRVLLRGLGHTVDFWNTEPAARTHLITTYLDSGRVDASRYRPRTIDLRPAMTQTRIAKVLVAVLVALPLLAALALAGIGRRVRRRARLHPLTGALVRTAFAAVLGLAGWMAAVLGVLAVSAPVGLDDPSLVMAAVALPVAAGAASGWMDRRRSRRTRLTGIAAAVAGAVIGARLGFGAAEQFLALFTAIVGAVAGANLALIARDVWAGDDAVPPAPAAPRPQRRVPVAA